MRNIFIGLTDIASQISEYKQGFESLGHKVFTAVMLPQSSICDGRYDTVVYDAVPRSIKDTRNIGLRLIRRVIIEIEKRKLWNYAVKNCDTFVFMWSSFQKNRSDFRRLKQLGKKVIVCFVGSDIRWSKAMEQEFRFYGIPPIEYDEHSQSRTDLHERLVYLRNAEKYADVILSAPNQSQLALRPFHTFFVPVSLEKFHIGCPQRLIPKVLHLPSYAPVKGTKYVMKVFSQLQNEGIAFEPQTPERLPFKEAINAYQDADILVGQLLGAGGGKQEREVLACGKVVLSNMRYVSYPENIPPDCPIVDVGPDNLYDELKHIILDYPRRVALAELGRDWVQKHHDNVTVCQRILNLLDTDNLKPDYYPTFFREKFIPENKERTDIYNKWTRYVNDCDWYKKYVSSDTRDGLIF